MKRARKMELMVIALRRFNICVSPDLYCAIWNGFKDIKREKYRESLQRREEGAG